MTDPQKSVFERVYDAIRQIPAGRVTTYGQIARLSGAGSGRVVGFAMNALRKKHADDVPWYRVLNAQGKINLSGEGGRSMQRDLLKAEGVEFDENGVVDFERFGWLA